MSDASYTSILTRGLLELGISIADHQLAALLEYHQRFIKWNQAYNLSAIRDPEEMLYKHLLDSLSVVPHVNKSQALHFVDVGTGGGLPGIPLAICFPERRFTLLDSAGKKTRFLQQTKFDMKLANVEVINRRVEDFLPATPFDVVISRAFATLYDMVSWCQHLIDDKGEFWAMKGVFPQDELSVLQKNYKVGSCSTLSVPGHIGERCLVVIQPDLSPTS